MQQEEFQNDLIGALDLSNLKLQSPHHAQLIVAQKKTSPNAKTHRAGDWVCMICNNLNYSFRKVCNRCQIQSKRQNLLQSLMLLNEPGSLQNSFSDSDEQVQKYAAPPKRRVPFGDLTNTMGSDSNTPNLLMESLKLPQKQQLAKKHNLEKKGMNEYKGFSNAILLNDDCFTPKKDPESTPEDPLSPEQYKMIRCLLDSGEKYPEVTPFSPTKDDGGIFAKIKGEDDNRLFREISSNFGLGHNPVV